MKKQTLVVTNKKGDVVFLYPLSSFPDNPTASVLKVEKRRPCVRLNLRLPQDLHKSLVARAGGHLPPSSLNTEIVKALYESFGKAA